MPRAVPDLIGFEDFTMTRVLKTLLVTWIALFVVAPLSLVRAEVVRVQIDRREPFAAGQSFGSVISHLLCFRQTAMGHYDTSIGPGGSTDRPVAASAVATNRDAQLY